MTDTRARDALAAALAARGMIPCSDPDCPDQHFGWCAREVDAILAHPFTPDQRRALAAAFLDVDLSEYVVAALNELGVPDETYPAPVANAVRILQRGLAALRETT